MSTTFLSGETAGTHSFVAASSMQSMSLMLALPCEYACLSLICSLATCLVNEDAFSILVSPFVRVVVGKGRMNFRRCAFPARPWLLSILASALGAGSYLSPWFWTSQPSMMHRKEVLSELSACWNACENFCFLRHTLSRCE